MKKIFKKIFISIITCYQHTVSPDHSLLRFFFMRGVCRFTPTCSQFTKEAIGKYGWQGVSMGVKRILRCHPFTTGGYDPVPRKKKDS